MRETRRNNGAVRWICGDFVRLGLSFRDFAVDCFKKFRVVEWSVCE